MRIKKAVLTTLGLIMALTIGLNQDVDTQYASKQKETSQYTLYTHGDHF
jgi:hypothetical protein